MKNIVTTTLAVLVLALAAPTQAQQIKVNIRDGHYAPLAARITYRNGKSKDVIVFRAWYSSSEDTQPDIQGVGEGDSAVKFWIDMIAKVKDTTDKEYTVVFKDGSERTLAYNSYWTGFGFQNIDGTTEFVQMVNFKSLEFFGPVRKDSKDNAMFDQWKYSPYTGEKLIELNR